MPFQGPFALTDGRSVWLRPLRASDATRLLELRCRLSPQTVRRRFLSTTIACGAEQARELAQVDQVERVAVAVVAEPVADAPIVAVGRFHRESPQRAELALLVEDAYQHLGIGRLLLTRLIRAARRRRLRELVGYVLYNNTPVLGLLRTSGLPLEVKWYGGDLLTIQLSLAEPSLKR